MTSCADSIFSTLGARFDFPHQRLNLCRMLLVEHLDTRQTTRTRRCTTRNLSLLLLNKSRERKQVKDSFYLLSTNFRREAGATAGRARSNDERESIYLDQEVEGQRWHPLGVSPSCGPRTRLKPANPRPIPNAAQSRSYFISFCVRADLCLFRNPLATGPTARGSQFELQG